jgi:hypothetical protein
MFQTKSDRSATCLAGISGSGHPYPGEVFVSGVWGLDSVATKDISLWKPVSGDSEADEYKVGFAEWTKKKKTILCMWIKKETPGET